MSNANINRTGISIFCPPENTFHCSRYLFLWSSFDPGAGDDDDEDNNIINCWTLTGQISLPITSLELLYEADDGDQDARPEVSVIGSRLANLAAANTSCRVISA